MNLGTIYVIVDVSPAARLPADELVRATLAGGADMIQLRAKSLDTRTFLHSAIACASLCRRRRVPFLVNDRADVAWASDADGVHLGDADLPLRAARELLGPHKILGASADTLDEVHARAAEGADYCGIGPVFATSTKADTGPVLGLDRLAQAVAASPIPLVAIGGITLERLAEVAATGVHAVAMVSAIAGAEDPEQATRRARAIWDRARPSESPAR